MRISLATRRWGMAAAVALLAACRGGSSRDPVVVAAVGNWEGDEERTLRQGIELAAAEVNRDGGVDGRPLQVEFHDDDDQTARAAEVARALVDDPRVVAVIGHTRSDPTVVAAKAYDGHVPVVMARLTSPDLVGFSRWVFQLPSTESAYGDAVASYAAEHGWKRAAVLFNNSARGRATASEFRRAFRGEVVSMDPLLFPVAPREDMELYVSYHRQQAPDVVFAPFGEPRHQDYIREAQRQGLRAPVIGWDVWDRLASDSTLPGTFMYVAPFDLRSDRAETRGFVTAFQAAQHREPTPFAALGYDAVHLVADVAAKEGATRQAIRDALAALTPGAPHQGATGPISFDSAGSVVGPRPVVTALRRGGR